MSRKNRIVVIHPDAKRAVELFRLFTGLGYDVASNWDVESLSLQPMFKLPVTAQTAGLSTADICKLGETIGNYVLAADAVLIDAGAEHFWAGFAAASRLKTDDPPAPIVVVGPPGANVGLQLLVARPGRATATGHESEWADVPQTLKRLGVGPTRETKQSQVEQTDERQDHDSPRPDDVVADRPEDADRDAVVGGES